MIKRLLGYGFESNVYLIIDERNAIIDAGTGFENENLIKEIRKYVDKIDYIILTHEHFDHCGGAPALKKFFGAKIFMHVNGAKIIENGMNIFSSFFGVKQEKDRVDIKLNDGDHIEIGGYNLKTIHTPGHSPGSICLYEEDKKILFSGDTIFLYGGIGRTDFYGGNHDLLLKSIKKISKFEINALYPGHGEYAEENAYLHIRMAMKTANLL